MPLSTQRYDFEDEIERLTGLQEDLGDEASEWDPNVPQTQEAANRSEIIQKFKEGLRWALEDSGWGEGFVILGELNAAEYAALQKYTPDDPTDAEYQTVLTAVGTVKGPYIEGDTQETLKHLRDSAKPQFNMWAAGQLNDLMGVDGVDENPFFQRLNRAVDNE